MYDSLVVSISDWLEVPESCPLIGQYSAIYHQISACILSVSLPARDIDIIRFK